MIHVVISLLTTGQKLSAEPPLVFQSIQSCLRIRTAHDLLITHAKKTCAHALWAHNQYTHTLLCYAMTLMPAGTYWAPWAESNKNMIQRKRHQTHLHAWLFILRVFFFFPRGFLAFQSAPCLSVCPLLLLVKSIHVHTFQMRLPKSNRQTAAQPPLPMWK